MRSGAGLAMAMVMGSGLFRPEINCDGDRDVEEVIAQRRREFEAIKADAAARREQAERKRIERETPIIAAAEAKRERRRQRNLRVNKSA